MKTNKMIKNILWMIILIFIIIFLHAVAVIILHPRGGGEIHEIFAYSGGGRLHVAAKVYWEYIIIGCLISSIMIFCRYPVRWYVVAFITSMIVLIKWLGICFFPYQSRGFHEACMLRSYFISALLLINGFIASFLSSVAFNCLKEKE